MSVPVHCPFCGLRFSSRALSISNSINVTLSGNRETCPRCGKMANVQDGVYDFVGDTISSVRRLRAEDLEHLRSVLRATDTGDMAAAVAVSEASSLDPSFGKLVATLQAVGGIPLLIMLISLYIQYASLKEAAEDQEAVLAELRASNVHQEQIISSMRELIEAQDVPEPQPYSPRKPGTRHTQSSEASGSDRAERRRAWKQEKKRLKDKSVKFQK